MIGSGPAAFYATAALLRSEEPLVHVDVYEKLPTPWGLVRSGVAPDHPKIKNVGATFAKTADHDRFRFFGNVEFGRDVSRAELLERYDSIVYAVGAKSDNRLGIPGEDLPGSIAATDFVGWYNAHPEFRDFAVDLSTERVVVIGAGNVALDVARMLVTDTEVLAGTDVADHALAALRASKVREVVVVARRGPVQGAFTTQELRELGELDDVDCVLDPADLAGFATETMKDAPHTVRTNIEAMHRLVNDHPPTGRPRRLVLRFARSPIEIRPDESGQVGEIVLGHNDLVAQEDGSVRAQDSGLRETLSTGLVVRAVGYRGVALPEVAFDERRGIIIPGTGRPGHRRRTGVRHRLDQARTQRRHRDQPQGRSGDRGGRAGGPGRAAGPQRGGDRGPGGLGPAASPGGRRGTRLAGNRPARDHVGGRRSAAGQAVHGGRDARRGRHGTSRSLSPTE